MKPTSQKEGILPTLNLGKHDRVKIEHAPIHVGANKSINVTFIICFQRNQAHELDKKHEQSKSRKGMYVKAFSYICIACTKLTLTSHAQFPLNICPKNMTSISATVVANLKVFLTNQTV